MKNTLFRLGVIGIIISSLVLQSTFVLADVFWPYNSNYGYNQYYSGGSISLSQTNVSLNVGQSATITIYGGSAPYTMYPTTPNILQTVISGNQLTITGLNIGSGSVNVCSSGGSGSGCVLVSVVVSPVFYQNYPTYPPYPPYNPYTPPIYNQPIQSAITFSQTNPSVAVGQSMTILIYGGAGSGYYVAYNSNSNTLQTSLTGNSLIIQGLQTNSNNVLVICSSTTNCAALPVMVTYLSVNAVQPYYGNNGYGTWMQCAGENQWCSFPGTQLVQYGANGVYTYRTATNGILCSNTLFGDPIFGVAKRCSVGGSQY